MAVSVHESVIEELRSHVAREFAFGIYGIDDVRDADAHRAAFHAVFAGGASDQLNAEHEIHYLFNSLLLFIGAPDAGETAAILYTLAEECRRCKVNAETWFNETLQTIAAGYTGDYLALLPQVSDAAQ